MVVLLPLPEGHDALESDDWMTTANDQGGLPDAVTMEVGDNWALLDRNCFIQAWVPESRRVFVVRYSENAVRVFDEHGTPIDEPSDFVCKGVQPFAKSDGEHSFVEEWGVYYADPSALPDDETVPSEAVNLQPSADTSAATGSAAPEETGAQQPEGSSATPPSTLLDDLESNTLPLSPEPQGKAVPSGLPDDEPYSLAVYEESGDEAESVALVARLQNGTRLKMVHPTKPDAAANGEFERGSIFVRKENSFIAVFDDCTLDPPFYKGEITDEFVRECLTSDDFLEESEDVPAAERAVAIFVTRSGVGIEGTFYGAERIGMDECFLSPCSFRAIPVAKTTTSRGGSSAPPRYPHSFHTGCEITIEGRGEVYVFLKFLIQIESQQSRFYALVGNPSALLPSPTIQHRYGVVALKNKKGGPTFSVTSPLKLCEQETLDRLLEGSVAYAHDITAAELKRGDHGLPPLPTSYDPPNLRDRQNRPDANAAAPAATVGATGNDIIDIEDVDPSGGSEVVHPSGIPFNLNKVGKASLTTRGFKGGPVPTLRELQELCAHNSLPTSGTHEKLMQRLLGWKCAAQSASSKTKGKQKKESESDVGDNFSDHDLPPAHGPRQRRKPTGKRNAASIVTDQQLRRQLQEQEKMVQRQQQQQQQQQQWQQQQQRQQQQQKQRPHPYQEAPTSNPHHPILARSVAKRIRTPNPSLPGGHTHTSPSLPGWHSRSNSSPCSKFHPHSQPQHHFLACTHICLYK